jgi:hypothetical protein
MMNSARFAVKTQLLFERPDGKVPQCPLCPERTGNPFSAHNPAVHLHEIIMPYRKGSKYQPNLNDELAQAIYVRENCILLCVQCNVSFANSYPRDKMLALKMNMPGYAPEQVVEKLRDIARQLKYPEQWLPREVEFDGVVYQILHAPCTLKESDG